MATADSAGGVLATLSDELAAAVERASRSIVTVNGRPRNPASGVVWPGGLVVTADHVLERDEDITVGLPGGGESGATIAGRDPGSDIAVLKLAGGAAEAAELAPAGALKVGHFVLALGRPGEGNPSASFGVVSALGGSWRTARGGVVDDYIRADLTLYPGFSGGPLVDTRGRVVGLNSSHLARGAAVAISAATVGAIARTLQTQGRVKRGYLGVVSQPVQVPAALRQRVGAERETALMIVGVEPGSPAERGGILMGDVLIAVAGQSIADAPDLQAALGAGVVGKPTVIAVVRAGERKDLRVTPGERT